MSVERRFSHVPSETPGRCESRGDVQFTLFRQELTLCREAKAEVINTRCKQSRRFLAGESSIR
jgi:hypothetical protein